MSSSEIGTPPALSDRLAVPPTAVPISASSALATGATDTAGPNPELALYRSRLASFPPPKYADKDSRNASNREKEKERDAAIGGMMGMNLTNLAPSSLSANLSNSVSDLFLSSLLPSSLPRASSAQSSGQNNLGYGGGRFLPLTSQREALSLPVMTNNFRRFVARCGFIFWLMDRVEEVVYWRRKERTLLYIVGWAIMSFHPRLILLIPSTVLIILLLSSYVASHPSLTTRSIPSTTMHSESIYGSASSASQPSGTGRPSASPQPSNDIGSTSAPGPIASSSSLIPQSLNPGSIKAGLLASQLARDVMGKVTMNYDANHLGLGLGVNSTGIGSSPRKGSAAGTGGTQTQASDTAFVDVISNTAAEMKKQEDSSSVKLDQDRSRSREAIDRSTGGSGGASAHTIDPEGGAEVPTAPAGTAESGVDYYMNLQGIQNLMGMASDVHDMVIPYAPLLTSPAQAKSGPLPPITFPLSTTHILLLLLLLLPPTVILPLLPSSTMPFVLLILGWAPLVVFHPSFSLASLQPVIAFANQLAVETLDWYHGTETTVLPTDSAQYGLKRLYSKAERLALTDRLEDAIARSEIREVFVWENERLDGSWVANHVKPGEQSRDGSGLSDQATPADSSWGEKYLRSSERQGWVKALPMNRLQDSLWEDNAVIANDGGYADGSGARTGQRVALSLVKGWAFVPGEEWRVDVVGDWNGLRADEKGWVYFNDAWEDPSTQAIAISRSGDATKRQIKVTRRRRWWRRAYSESSTA